MATDRRFVKFLQRLLNERGYELAVDGEAGDKTRAALKDFQEQMGLRPDGRATEATLKALRKAETAKAVPTPTPRPSMPGAMAKAAAAYPSREPRPMPPPMMPAEVGTPNPMTSGFGDTEFGGRFDPTMEGTLGPDAARPWAVPPPAGFNDGMTFAGPDDPAMQQQLEIRAGQATGNSPLAGGDMPPMQMAPQPPAAGPDFSQADPAPPIPDNIMMALRRALGGSAQAAEAPPEMEPGQRGIGSDYVASAGADAEDQKLTEELKRQIMEMLRGAIQRPQPLQIDPAQGVDI